MRESTKDTLLGIIIGIIVGVSVWFYLVPAILAGQRKAAQMRRNAGCSCIQQISPEQQNQKPKP